MTSAALQTVAPDLRQLVRHIAQAEGFPAVVASLRAGHGATLDGVRGSATALVAATLVEDCSGVLVVVCPHQADIDELAEELSLFTARTAEKFPARESLPGESLAGDEIFGDRLRLLKLLGGPNRPRLIITSIQSLLEPVPEPPRLAAATRRLETGQVLDLDELTAWLVERGYHNTSAVALPGEFAPRGGLLDIFAPDWYDPVRVELFGDQVDSLRRFDVSNQRSLEVLPNVDITALDAGAANRSHLSDYLPAGSWFLLIEPGEAEEEGRHYLNRLDRPEGFHTVRDALQEVYRFPSVTAASLSISSLETTCRLRTESVERFSGDIAKVRHELDTAGQGQQVIIICPTEAEGQRLGEVLGGSTLAGEGKLHFLTGRLRSGFRLVEERIVLVSGNELFHRADVSRPTRRRLGRVIDSFLELREGDLVVHVAHGIGRYRGLRLLDKEEHVEEHLEVEFDGGTKIYVPVSKIELVQKYVGGSKSHPTLAKIGSRTWVRQKEAAEEAVVDLASDMLELQAARASRPGITFPPDSEWQRAFDAAFPYHETPDQTTGIAAIKHDMQEPRPMDRLICGDVGYGKTELAMRAAFKAVDAGYQAAVLVPTTVLAAQHGRTFRARLSEYPFRIEVLSRFCTARQQQEILHGLADGSVDLVIGTHRLAQSDVQFRNLGLVMIDEEQRFGVGVKERLKAYRQIVDVLTLTATPIPRTLHMSLLGLRDITNLETPPADRLAVETQVTRFDEELIRHAILRELNRGGQAFFVHNRVHDIEKVAWRLRQIVPEARIGIGHGQMAEGQLEQVMLEFVDHQFDILLATTIVESGLDIPNANTIFIDDADQYGLADLHQLRGRARRYKHRAYCYLLVNPSKSLSTNAARRLTAIEEFSNMGAGFAIAMRDLEIRGAGNILGTEQSGHISTVGYELYCELLEKTVRRLKHLPPKTMIEVGIHLPGQAYLPRRYVSDLRLKIDLYRRLARITTHDELRDLAAEIGDRFGPPPVEVVRLLGLAELRVLAQAWRVESIHLEQGYVVLGYSSRPRIEQLARRKHGALRIVDDRSAYLPLSEKLREPDSLLNLLKSLLQPD